jgi:transcriptional antiterminator RfaH
MSPYWAVAQTESQRESIAATFLNQANYETYLPKIVVKTAARQRIVPLFPAYIFVRIVDQFWTVRWTIGVLRLIMADNHPAIVGDKIITAIRKREGENGLVRLPNIPSGPRLGQQVRIIRGSFADRIGIYDGMHGPDRVRILLDLLGRSVPVSLPPIDIQPLVSSSC